MRNAFNFVLGGGSRLDKLETVTRLFMLLIWGLLICPFYLIVLSSKYVIKLLSFLFD